LSAEEHGSKSLPISKVDEGAYDDDLEPVESGAGACTVAVESTHEPSHLPRGPGGLSPTEGGHFVIKDATGFSVCYVYARTDSALRNQYMTPAEALVIAEQIAKLPELGEKVPGRCRAFSLTDDRV
jgi:hypothetical protein